MFARNIPLVFAIERVRYQDIVLYPIFPYVVPRQVQKELVLHYSPMTIYTLLNSAVVQDYRQRQTNCFVLLPKQICAIQVMLF